MIKISITMKNIDVCINKRQAFVLSTASEPKRYEFMYDIYKESWQGYEYYENRQTKLWVFSTLKKLKEFCKKVLENDALFSEMVPDEE